MFAGKTPQNKAFQTTKYLIIKIGAKGNNLKYYKTELRLQFLNY
jgi:hypothetical protein